MAEEAEAAAGSQGNKVKEEDAAAAPLPDKAGPPGPGQRACVPRSRRVGRRVRPVRCVLQCQVGGSPVYLVEKKLGKGGFGQVYQGKRQAATTSKEGSTANLVGARAVQLTLADTHASRLQC